MSSLGGRRNSWCNNPLLVVGYAVGIIGMVLVAPLVFQDIEIFDLNSSTKDTEPVVEHTILSVEKLCERDGQFDFYLKAQSFVESKTELEYFIFVPIMVGKTVTLIPMPIYDKYNVYKTDFGLFVASDSKLELGRSYTVTGHIEQNSGKCVYFIDYIKED